MVKFFTKYKLKPRVLRVYDSSDNVDRLSYCDTATSIMRFMKAGRDLRFSRSQAMYKNFTDIGDEVGTENIVYASDPVDMANKIHSMEEELKVRVSASENRAKRSVAIDKVADKTDLDAKSKNSISQVSESEPSA